MRCPICNKRMERDDEGLWYCEKCDRTFWYNPFTDELEDDDYMFPSFSESDPDDLEWSDL